MPIQEIKNLKELKKLSCELVKTFKIPQVVLLEGPLAVGKTQMIRYMAQALDLFETQVHSPSFSLINVYKTKQQKEIHHVDLYRLKSLEEVENIAFWDIFYSPHLVFVEWPDLVKKKLPAMWNKLYIELSFLKDTSWRQIQWRHESKS